VFHNHLTVDMLAAVFDFHSRAFAELRDEFWLRVMTRAAEEGLDGLIFTFVFEPTVLPGFYERLKAGIESKAGTLHSFQLTCSLEENVRRVQQADRGRYLKMTSPEILQSSLGQGVYEPKAAMTNNVTIDTTDLSAVETAGVITRHLT
jgi:hypothetical protein